MKLILFSIALVTLSIVSVHAQMTVRVYYETLCGDSKRFIRSQLYPTVKSMGQNKMNFELIPYGKATTTKSEDGRYQFECQHGEDECFGNKVHSCALKHLTKQESMDFIYCSMSTNYPPESLEECAAKLRMNNVDKIKNCAGSQEGDELLAINGNLTHSLQPQLYFVPWITYNGEFEAEKLIDSQNKFKTVLCKHESAKEACSGIPNPRGERKVRQARKRVQ